jgi:hypothetical protein
MGRRHTTSAEYAVGSPAPEPNQGDEANQHHWRYISEEVARLRQQGYDQIRVNQQQVGGGLIVGENRPDIQATGPNLPDVIVEVDSDPRASRQHRRDILRGIRRTPRAQRGDIDVRFITFHPRTGRVTRQDEWCYRCRRRRVRP